MKRIRACIAASLCVCITCMLFSGCADYAIMVGLKQPSQVTDVTIKVAAPMDYARQNTAFLEGVQLAIADIKDLDSPVGIHVDMEDDFGSYSGAIDLMQRYAEDPSVVGVVGHWYSDICSAVSELYSRAGVTLLVPTVSITGLVSQETPYIFQNITSDSQIGKSLCDYAISQGVKSVVIYYEDSTYGFTMSAEVERYCRQQGISVSDKLSSIPLERGLAQAKLKWDAAGYEAVLLISNVEEGAEFVNALRAAGSSTMVLCADGMDSESLPKLLDDHDGEIYVASIYDSQSEEKNIKAFQDRFRNQYGKEPDVWALQGYDCVMMIATAVAKHGVRSSEQLREYLESTEKIESIYGVLSFNRRHEVEGKQIYLKKASRAGMEQIEGDSSGRE